MWLSSKESACQARDARGSGSISVARRSPGEGNGNPFQYSCLGNPMDRGPWQATVHGVTESQTWLSMLCHPDPRLGILFSPQSFHFQGQSCSGLCFVSALPFLFYHFAHYYETIYRGAFLKDKLVTSLPPPPLFRSPEVMTSWWFMCIPGEKSLVTNSDTTEFQVWKSIAQDIISCWNFCKTY